MRKNLYKLTKSEEQILELLVRGYSRKEIASKLSVSITTVITHIYNISDKFLITSGNRDLLIVLNYLGYLKGNEYVKFDRTNLQNKCNTNQAA